MGCAPRVLRVVESRAILYRSAIFWSTVPGSAWSVAMLSNSSFKFFRVVSAMASKEPKRENSGLRGFLTCQPPVAYW